MIVGVPGAGISAFFYIVCVALMPFNAAWRMARGKNPRWRLVARQLAIGGGIVVGLVAGGAAVAGVAAAMGTPTAQPAELARAALEIGLLSGPIGIFLGIGTMVLVLGSVQLFALLSAKPDYRAGGGVPSTDDHPSRANVQLASQSGPERARGAES